MKLLNIIVATLALVAAGASADNSIEGRDLGLPAMSKHPLSMQRRDAILSARAKPRVARRHSGSKKSCHARTKNAASGIKKHHKLQSNSQSQSKASAQSQSQNQGESQSQSNSNQNQNQYQSSSSSSGGSSSGGGLFGFSFGSCGSSDANDQQPNGAQSFLNCGVTSGGWNPPKISLDQLKIISASQAADSPVFAPCKDVLWAFQAAESKYSIPATVLMSFAMQESTCNPQATGGNGEQGLMQITPDKCGGAPGGNCKDPGFNVDTGARYFKQTLDSCGGSVLQAIGQYNGWQIGLTVQSATAAKYQGNCYAQNNLDYLYQMLNGWFLGKNDAYSLGTYKNLASC